MAFKHKAPTNNDGVAKGHWLEDSKTRCGKREGREGSCGSLRRYQENLKCFFFCGSPKRKGLH